MLPPRVLVPPHLSAIDVVKDPGQRCVVGEHLQQHPQEGRGSDWWPRVGMSSRRRYRRRDDAKGVAIMARHPYPIHTIRTLHTPGATATGSP